MAEFKNATLLMPEAPGPWVDEFRCTCGDHIADYRKTRLNVTWMDGVNRLRERNSGIEGGGYRSRGPVLRAMNQIKMERWYAQHVNCNTCEIVRDHKDWWTEQEDKARSEGFRGKWEWCEPDDEDQDDEDDEDEEEEDDDDDDEEEEEFDIETADPDDYF